jgi:hypothetical protein
MNLSIHTKSINPNEAKTILEEHENYRKVGQKRVAAYAEEMKQHRWGLSVLIFNCDGVLVDGQSRLSAVIKSGTTQTFACIHGWPDDQTIYLDGGQNRSKSQVAQKERNVKNGNKIMSMVSSIEDPLRVGGIVLNSTAIDLYDKYGEPCEKVFHVASKGAFNAAVHMVAFARCIYLHPETETEILSAIQKVNDLDYSEERMIGLKLYYKWAIERGFAKGGGGMRSEAYKRCARAIVAYLRNEKLTKLYCPPDDPLLSYKK